MLGTPILRQEKINIFSAGCTGTRRKPTKENSRNDHHFVEVFNHISLRFIPQQIRDALFSTGNGSLKSPVKKMLVPTAQ